MRPSVCCDLKNVGEEGSLMRIKKEMQRTAERQSVPHDIRAASLSDISIAQSDGGVNIHDTQNGEKCP